MGSGEEDRLVTQSWELMTVGEGEQTRRGHAARTVNGGDGGQVQIGKLARGEGSVFGVVQGGVTERREETDNSAAEKTSN